MKRSPGVLDTLDRGPNHSLDSTKEGLRCSLPEPVLLTGARLRARHAACVRSTTTGSGPMGRPTARPTFPWMSGLSCVLTSMVPFHSIALTWGTAGSGPEAYPVTGMGCLRSPGRLSRCTGGAYAHFVSPISPGKQVDHMCWNRRCVNPTHLREVSQKENRENLGNLLANNTTGYHGVSFHKGHGKYVARVRNNGKSVYIGAFSTAEEAGEAARLARMTMFTHNDLDRITELTED